MSASRVLLTTKLYVPAARAGSRIVPRPRLIARLNEARARPLLLISAPAGCGKTTLLGDWIAHNHRRVAWLSLDEGDNDPARFWAYFTAALQTVQPNIGESAGVILQEVGQGGEQPLSLESFLTVLLNEMTASPEGFALVLDDYHVITTPAIHAGLTFLLDHLPPPSGMQVIIASRSDPPLPLARLRASNRMAEFRADDLRFTPDEVAVFLNQAMELDLSADDIAALEARTEGWIAGLQLAAVSLQGRDETARRRFVAAFTGSQRYILDYLVEEVLRRQPESTQAFLLQTSVLARLSGSLCDAVTGRADGQAMLEELERANLFLIPLDEERGWYRYHHLFAEVLHFRLQQAESDLLPELHGRASAWYEQNGFAAEAVEHALAARDFEHAARLVEESANTIFWRRSEVATLLRWLEALPDEVIGSRPRLRLLHAWGLLLSGRLADVEPRLEDAERGLRARAGGAAVSSGVSYGEPLLLSEVEVQGMRGQIAAIRARLARMHNDLPRSIELCHLALEYLPREDLMLRGVILLNLGIAYWQSGDVLAATQTLAETSAIGEPPGAALAALGFLGDLQAEQGHLHQAAKTYQQVLDLAAERGRQSLPMAAWAYVGMGELQRQWNELDEAERYTLTALELAKQWSIADGLSWAYLHMAQLKEARGDAAGAAAAFHEAEQVMRLHDVAPWTAAEVAGYAGRLWISQGNAAEATRWAASREHWLSVENDLVYMHKREYLALAQLLVAQDKLPEATELLARLLRWAETTGLTGIAIEILILQALTFQAQEQAVEAMTALERALALAEPEGYIRVFVDEDEPMAGLLRQVTGEQRLYAERLLAVLARSERAGVEAPAHPPESPPIHARPPTLVEPLTERELEVLRLVTEGLSNPEIAQKLYLSVGTVKVHLKHIYGKLEVSSRTQAAARARELSLL